MSSRYFIKELWKVQNIRGVLPDKKIINELFEVGAFQGDSFRMVGIFYTSSNDEIYCCPKYISDDLIERANKKEENATSELREHMKLIVKVLDKLRADGKNIEEISYDFSAYSSNSERKHISRYSIAKGIVSDFLENGIYFKSEKEVSQSGRGKVRWGLTMRKMKPIISSDEIIYPKLLKQSDYKNYENIITEIHENIVVQCIDYLQMLDEKMTIEKPIVNIKLQPEEMHKYSKYIKQSMLTAYSNRELLLFKAMLSWCDESPYYKGMGCTTCFLNVWEWVNDAVWGNKQKELLKSSAPKYHLAGIAYIGGGDAEPDTLAYIEGEKDYIALFDAKYYVPKNKEIKLEPQSIIGFPENREIVKQVAYLKDIQSVCGDAINYSNIFLLPTCESYKNIVEEIEDKQEDNIWQMIGLACKGSFDSLRKALGLEEIKVADEKEDYVGVALISPEKLYHQYLESGRIAEDKIVTIAEKYLDMVSKV